MQALFVGFIVYALASLVYSIARKIPKPRKRKTAATDKAPAALSVLNSLQEQRDIIADLLSDIEYRLDTAPPEKTREKLLKDKARLCGQLATVENKIAKLNN